MKGLDLRLLIMGGTRFVGRHIADSALSRGHAVTLFNRGQSGPGLFPDAEHLLGDRERDLTQLAGRHWDAVIDTCGYIPQVVRASAEALAGSVDNYTFISTLSVYGDLAATHGDFSKPNIDELHPVATLREGDSRDEVTMPTYGALKALCENEVTSVFPGRTFIPRCGLIVGPHDTSGRFTYWPRRLSRGGEVLGPGRPHAAVQLIDVRDLARWIMNMVEVAATGTFNATGPADPLTMEDVLLACADAAKVEPRITWVGDDFLDSAGIRQYTEMPLWVRSRPETEGFSKLCIDKAVKEGLAFRSLSETIVDTLQWDATQPDVGDPTAGISSDKERELLHAWHAAHPTPAR